MGRHSTYDPELAAEICERLSTGETLRAICRDPHMPHWTTVYAWKDAHEEFGLRIARARELGFDAIAEDTIEMIDETPERCETQFGTKVDAGHVAWQKNRVDQRLKLLAKWSPKYADKQQIDLKAEVDIAHTIVAARKRAGGN